MADTSSAPYVAVVGGFLNLDDAEKKKAIGIAESLGEALANAGFNLIVYNSDKDFLEPHVVRGYVPQAQDRKHCIRIRIPQKLRDKATFVEEATHSEMFDPNLFASEDWEAPFYQSLANEDDVDAVVLLSGGDSTLIAGHIAFARKLPVLAVADLGGSAYKIWTQLKLADPSIKTWKTLGSEQSATMLRAQCDDARKVREDRERKTKRIESWASTRRYGWLCGATLGAFLLALGYAISNQPSPAGFKVATIIGLLAAGATGALARGVIWANTRSDPGITLLLGALAGLIVGLGYIVPQLVGSAGVFDPERPGGVITTDIIQFLSAVLVSMSAGVGFDTVFDRLRTQAESLPISGDKT